MSVYDSIIKGLNEAIQYEKGELRNVKVDRKVIASLPRYSAKEIKAIRLKQKMSQQTFAYALGVSKKTIEAWEAGRNVPSGPARRMLQLMHKDEGLLEKYEIMEKENN